MITEVEDWEDWGNLNCSGITNAPFKCEGVKQIEERTVVSWRMEERKLEERRLIEESDRELVRELFGGASTIKLDPILISPIIVTPITSPTSSEMKAKNAKKGNYRVEHELKQKAHAKKVLEFAVKQQKVAEIYGEASKMDKYDEYDAKFY
jgi:superfamily II DNA or RNA helicase